MAATGDAQGSSGAKDNENNKGNQNNWTMVETIGTIKLLIRHMQCLSPLLSEFASRNELI